MHGHVKLIAAFIVHNTVSWTEYRLVSVLAQWTCYVLYADCCMAREQVCENCGSESPAEVCPASWQDHWVLCGRCADVSHEVGQEPHGVFTAHRLDLATHNFVVRTHRQRASVVWDAVVCGAHAVAACMAIGDTSQQRDCTFCYMVQVGNALGILVV